MARAPTDIRSLARSHTEIAIKILAGIAKDGTNDAARVSAAVALLDRGWGKPPQAHTGEDGDDIKVTVRTIIEEVPTREDGSWRANSSAPDRRKPGQS